MGEGNLTAFDLPLAAFAPDLGAFLGVIIVMGAAYVQTEAFTWEAFLAALPVGLLTAAILHANNLRDLEDDRAHGKRTLASLVGRPRADYELVALVLGAFALAVALPASGAAPLTTLIALARTSTSSSSNSHASVGSASAPNSSSMVHV